MSKLVTLSLVALLALALGGCNTIHGFGHDVEEAGDAISDAAD
ncbi:entericidin A/B family lipoprotein [Maricaulis sp. CAU 1757]